MTWLLHTALWGVLGAAIGAAARPLLYRQKERR